MIDFQCSRCGQEFSVEDNQAGKRAKCTRCSTMLRIPDKSYRALQIYGDEPIFHNEHLDSLYESFLADYEDSIVQHRVIESEAGAFVMMEIATQPFRTQLVWLVMVEFDGDPRILIYSIAGSIENTAQAYAALKVVKLVDGLTLAIDEDDVLKIGKYGRLEWFDEADFADAILSVATFTDIIEDHLFGGDAH